MEHILKQCQLEECDATILIKGPYCSKHTQGESLPKVAKNTGPPSASSQRPPSNGRPSQQNSPQSNGNPAKMVPQEEKLGDAITVKTPVTPLHTSSEKRQLSGKGVARKTAGGSSSKPKQSPIVSRHLESKPLLDQNSTRDAILSDQRPSKRPRLSDDVDKERAVHRPIPALTTNTAHHSPVIKVADPEERSLGSAAASDFALRPKKENSASLEIPPRTKPQERQGTPATRPPHKDLPRKEQGLPSSAKKYIIPAHNVIDLTKDDDPPAQSSSSSHGDLYSRRQESRDRTAEARCRAGKVAPETRREAKSIEAQIPPDRGMNTPTRHNDTSGRNEQNNVLKTNSNSSSHHLPNKQHLSITPRPISPIPPPDYMSPFFNPQSKLFNDKKKAPQLPKNHIERPMDVPRQSSEQARRTTPALDLAATERALSFSATDRSPVVRTVPGLPSTNDVYNKAYTGSWSTSSSQTLDHIRGVIEGSISRKENGTSSQSQAAQSYFPSPRSSTEENTVPPPRPRSSGERSVTSTRTIDKWEEAEPLTSTQFRQVVHEGTQTSEYLLKDVEPRKGVGGLIDVPTNRSTLASMVWDRSWRRLSSEERRRVLIAKHDPDKFDSYIYGRMNEPFRPGSALFGLPYCLLPPRPTCTATHFAHIDPRIHWNHPRTDKWHREKQREIRARGNRKANFAQAAVRVAKRRWDEGDDPPRVDLPERVKNNPKWMAALEELDQMAEHYHMQRRKGHKEDMRKNAKVQPNEGRERIVTDVDEDAVGQGFMLIRGAFKKKQ